MSKITENPFGNPKSSKDNTASIKRFLAVLTKEMGLYRAYNSDTLVKSYRYCKNELGGEFDSYVRCVRNHIRLQEADYKSGKVAVHYLTDVFTKFPKIINQLKKEGKWDGDYPYGWRVDSTGAPFHKDYQLISRSINGFIFANKRSKEPIVVVYNKDTNQFKSIKKLNSGETIWIAK